MNSSDCLFFFWWGGGQGERNPVPFRRTLLSTRGPFIKSERFSCVGDMKLFIYLFNLDLTTVKFISNIKPYIQLFFHS